MYLLLFPLIKHLQGTKYGIVFVLVVVGIFLGMEVLRYWQQPSRWIRKLLSFQDDTGKRLRILLAGRYQWKVCPGQYIRIWTPRICFWRSLPLQILWWGYDDHQHFYIELAVPKSGFFCGNEQNEISVEAAERTRLAKQQFWMSGPYGKSVSLQQYHTVVLFATNSGIAAQIPYVLDLFSGRRHEHSNLKRLLLCWKLDQRNFSTFKRYDLRVLTFSQLTLVITDNGRINCYISTQSLRTSMEFNRE